MSSIHLASAFENATTKNAERLVLIALAEACDHAGRISMDAEQIARRANVSPATLKRALKALQGAGLLDGDPTDDEADVAFLKLGNQPLMGDTVAPFDWSESEPTTAHQPPSQVGTAEQAGPAPLPKNDVARVIEAAGVTVDPAAPLYWSRVGHHDDLETLTRETGLKVQQIIDLCRRHSVRAGPIRRLTQLRPHIERAKRRPQ